MTEPASIRAARLRRDGEDLEIPAYSVPKWRDETHFAEGVVHLAQNCGWLAMHIRPARTRVRGEETYRTPIVGDKGFADIFAIHRTAGRLVYAELKMPPETQVKGRPTEDQQEWLDAMEEFARWVTPFATDTRLIERAIVRVWRPEDYDREIVPTFAGAWEVRNG